VATPVLREHGFDLPVGGEVPKRHLGISNGKIGFLLSEELIDKALLPRSAASGPWPDHPELLRTTFANAL
jgi:hypothetical protein